MYLPKDLTQQEQLQCEKTICTSTAYEGCRTPYMCLILRCGCHLEWFYSINHYAVLCPQEVIITLGGTNFQQLGQQEQW
jgi:hypothetical protein